MRTLPRLLLALALAPFAAGCAASGLPVTDDGDGATRSDGGAGFDGSAGFDGAAGCHGLDEVACRATAGCVASTCFACSCAPAFAGCLNPSEPLPECPATGCAEPLCCHGANDCPVGDECVAPGASVGGGACLIPPACATDADCAQQGPTSICALVDQPCGGGPMMGCVPGCASDGDCPVGELCRPDHRCVPMGCVADADCPRDFLCTAGGDKVPGCHRRTCATAADCHGDYCVDGACYAALGSCEPPAP